MTLVHKQGRLKHSPGIKVEGTLLSITSPSTSAARIEEPFSPLLNYFEIEIVESGAECAIGIGAGELKYPLSRMPGWNKNSVGYHADDGRLYHERGIGSAFGPRCQAGNRMGCGVDFTHEDSGYVKVFFTRNSERVGQSVQIKRPLYGLYPLIGLHSGGEKVRYLGHWQYDPDTLSENMVLEYSPSNHWLRCNAIKFVGDGLTLEYCGDGSRDVGIAQARHKMTREQHYFEMEILSRGESGALAIGVASRTYPLHVHPGWNPGAIGYHADDGKVFIGRGIGEEFGPVCGEGDRMGCGVRYSHTDDEDDGSSPSASDEDSDDDSACVDNSIGREDFIQRHRVRMRGMRHYLNDDQPRIGAEIRQRYGMQLLARHQPFNIPFDIPEQVVAKPSTTTDTNFSTKCVVYFTKNGELVGEREMPVPKGGFYPVVAMLSKGESLQVEWSPLTG